MKKRTSFPRVLAFIFALLVALLALVPFYMMFIMGTYRSEQLFTGLKLLPGNYLTKNMETVLSTDYIAYYFNSFYVAVCSTALSLISCAMCGYGIAKFQFRLKGAMTTIVLITMMVPSQLGIVAFVWEMKQLGWANSHLSLIIPSMASAFGAFWMIQSSQNTIPTEVLESARIDGCGEFMIFARIALPFLRPALFSLALLFFVGSWNSYLMPLVLINKPSLYTIPLGIQSLADAHRTDFGAQILGLSLSTLPMMVVFLLFSKNLIEGLTVGAVKG